MGKMLRNFLEGAAPLDSDYFLSFCLSLCPSKIVAVGIVCILAGHLPKLQILSSSRAFLDIWKGSLYSFFIFSLDPPLEIDKKTIFIESAFFRYIIILIRKGCL